ncbi:MAG: hypothetical protein NVSMB60_12800 [Mycobacterium sp.]
MKRLVFEAEHEQLRDTARQFLEKECAPHVEKWESERLVDRESYVAAGKYGLIGFNMPELYGGGGVDDFRFNAVIVEELSKFGPATPGLSLQNDIVGPYFASLATEEQKERWLAGYITGELIGAIAMTEPGAGSDLAGIKTSAVRDGDDWILNGSKTFISAGINSDLVIVVARTDPEGGTRASRCLSSSGAWRASSAGASSTKWACMPPTPPSCISRTSGCPATICSVRRGTASTTSCTTCRRSGCRSPSPRSPARVKPGARPCNTSRTATHSASRSAASNTIGS